MQQNSTESTQSRGVRFGPFRWDAKSGDLRRDQGPGSSNTVRLAPQPARLLTHLVDRAPNVVTHDEIQTLLWPNVEVAFEESVHTCIRTIRAALGDSASAPEYIETIPRRGYRFIGTVHHQTQCADSLAAAATEATNDDESTRTRVPLREETRDPPTQTLASRRRGPVALGLLLTLGVIVVGLLSWGSRNRVVTSATNATRIAVMPFEPTIGSEAGSDAPQSLLPRDNDLAESIVEFLANGYPTATIIVGPTTTVDFDGRPQRLRDLIREFDIDYVVNARESRTDSGSRVLVEVIRACDGAHVWVRHLDQLQAGGDPANLIAEAAGRAATSSDGCPRG